MIDVVRMNVCVVGLGYVGLPLAAALSEHFDVVGFDVNPTRLQELKAGYDRTNELEVSESGWADRISFVGHLDEGFFADVFIVTVPTPIYSSKEPNLEFLREASLSVGSVLKKGQVVIYESTVYPGCTREYCQPILERQSGLVAGNEFGIGYSPERINPGDRDHNIKNMVKVLSVNGPKWAGIVELIYGSIVDAGVYWASSIETAELAKVLENTQRDVNIALINEVALICDRLGLDTRDVVRVASTKWNFLPFEPGLVGGHCIGVDPYYLLKKAMDLGVNPEVITAGRRVNDGMVDFLAGKLLLESKRQNFSTILVCGLTFKANVPDFRNSLTLSLVKACVQGGLSVTVCDPYIDLLDSPDLLECIAYDVNSIPRAQAFGATVVAVPHREFLEEEFQCFLREDGGFIFDVTSKLDRDTSDWRL